MNTDWAGFSILQPIRGTKEYEGFESLGDERCKESHLDNYLPVNQLEASKERDELFYGMDIFNIENNAVVSQEQLKEIWFVFGFITNFINNKNLRVQGKIDKFVRWVEAAIRSYPHDAGMAVFLYLGHTIKGDRREADRYYEITKRLLENSAYWQRRFHQFSLSDVVENRLNGSDDVYSFLRALNEKLRLSYYVS